jgi:DNA-binding response OmpR family regulator
MVRRRDGRVRVPVAVPVERVLIGELHVIRTRLDDTLLRLARVAASAEQLGGWGAGGGGGASGPAGVGRGGEGGAAAASRPCGAGLLVVGELRIDRAAGRQWWGEREFELSPLHHRLLAVMAAEPDRLFGKEELAEAVWRRPGAEAGAVKTSVSRLRRALVEAGAPAGTLLRCSHGVRWTLHPTRARGDGGGRDL